MAILLMVPEDLRKRDNGKYSLSRRILKKSSGPDYEIGILSLL